MGDNYATRRQKAVPCVEERRIYLDAPAVCLWADGLALVFAEVILPIPFEMLPHLLFVPLIVPVASQMSQQPRRARARPCALTAFIVMNGADVMDGWAHPAVCGSACRGHCRGNSHQDPRNPYTRNFNTLHN